MAKTIADVATVPEIDINEIELIETVGEGSFGVVHKGLWRGRFVAVKNITAEAERKAFAVEVRQLSRVNHPNIIQLFGVCTSDIACLVMEYAEGGSLFNVLHCAKHIHYDMAHALSWLHQCAKGVAYLHAMQPKPLIHRDLKPPNLLLVDGGVRLKICDFGTAADRSTYMTNNKGSAAWMAPEVFTSCQYTEKCDVFSWGIILWEVLSRRKPFYNLGGSAYTIMWAVHKGNRPPPIRNCPPLIERLMVECWDQDPQRRPAMSHVRDEVERFWRIVWPHDGIPLPPIMSEKGIETMHSIQSEEEEERERRDVESTEDDSTDDAMCEAYTQVDERHFSSFEEDGQTILSPPPPPLVERGPLILPQPNQAANHLSQPLSVEVSPTAWELDDETIEMELRTMPGLDRMMPKLSSRKNINTSTVSQSNTVNMPPSLWGPPILSTITDSASTGSSEDAKSSSTFTSSIAATNTTTTTTTTALSHEPTPPTLYTKCQKIPDKLSDYGTGDFDDMHMLLDPHLRPATPDPNDLDSLRLFQQHKDMAQEYLKVQTELALLSQRRDQLLANDTEEQQRRRQHIKILENERESLHMVRDLLTKQQRRPTLTAAAANHHRHHSANQL